MRKLSTSLGDGLGVFYRWETCPGRARDGTGLVDCNVIVWSFTRFRSAEGSDPLPVDHTKTLPLAKFVNEYGLLEMHEELFQATNVV